MRHPHAHQLVYAGDISFTDCITLTQAEEKARRFLGNTIEALDGTGVILKGNTVFRLLGASALTSAAQAGLLLFGDYKLFDVLGTVKNDLSWLRLVQNLKILTICEKVPVKVFEEASKLLPSTIIAPIYPLTDLEDADFKKRGEVNRETAVRAFFDRVNQLPINGAVCAPTDLRFTPSNFTVGKEIISPGIRKDGPIDANDTNAVNAMTIREAILAGTTIPVAGGMLREGGDLRGNTLRACDQIGEAIIERDGK